MTGVHFTEAVRDEYKTFVPFDPLVEPRLPPSSPARSAAGHRPSHLELVGRVPHYFGGVDQAELSAIVMPTSRRLAQSRIGLELASQIAEARDAQLVVLRSGPATLDRFPAELSAMTSRPTTVIDLPARVGGRLPELSNARHRVATQYRKSDLGLKRNLALLLGLACGWKTVLLLDDDITTRRAAQLPRRPLSLPADVVLRLNDVFAAFAASPDLKAAGYLQKDFDDNSVVCHVRKLAGLEQEEFISGGALVVRCTDEIPFFPAAYNEDWLFLFAVMLQDRQRPSSGVQRIGSVHQAAYYPFKTPRARGEEFGDVFAEGLFALLDQPAVEIVRAAASVEYWKDVVHERKTMITAMLGQFQEQHGATDHQVINDVDSCLRAALAVYPGSLAQSATLMTTYFQSLMADLGAWYEYTERLGQDAGGCQGLPEALASLGVEGAVEEVWPQSVPWLPKPRTRCSS